MAFQFSIPGALSSNAALNSVAMNYTGPSELYQAVNFRLVSSKSSSLNLGMNTVYPECGDPYFFFVD
jgi:hypothetical protein